ncbi:MAG: oligosaccharide flippase family protein [Candidatus Aminicenantes bacterium]|nr:oligosaccharide flippase family protein [Candidatus Aminicenantes bacterium]
MDRRRILINSIMSVLQIAVVSGVLFFLYKFLLNTIGAEKFGIWSLVLAATAVTQIADLGLSGGVVKFVAKYIARKEDKNVSEIIQTAVLTIGITVGFVLIIAYPFIKWVLRYIMPTELFFLASAILPFAFLALWLCVITSLFQSGLDGFQRFDIRSSLLMAGAILHLLLCFWLIPKYGLLGLAYAKVIQNASVLAASWFFLRRLIPSLPAVPVKWNRSLFKEMIGYSVNFQIISIASMLYDPITKALLSKFGNLSMVGYYQMASKMIQKLHALIIAANQVLVPAIAGLKEKTPEKIQQVYLLSYRLLFYLVFPLYSLIIISLPFISKIWIGYYERSFIVYAALLSVGWLLNTLASPAYHANLGIGKLRWNVVGMLATALLNVILGVLLGIFYHGMGVVIAWMLSLALGSSIIYISYHIHHKISFQELFPKSSRTHMAVCFLGILSALLIYWQLSPVLNILILNLLSIIVFISIIFIPYWRHPMRKTLMSWIQKEFFKSRQKNKSLSI